MCYSNLIPFPPPLKVSVINWWLSIVTLNVFWIGEKVVNGGVAIGPVAGSIVPANYDFLETPPTLNGVATKVEFSVILMAIRKIEEMDQEITMELNLRMFWKDTRLQKMVNFTQGQRYQVLNPVLLQELWHPDCFIDHAISVEQPALIKPPASLRIYNDSTLRYSSRMNVKMACHMEFQHYPMDRQQCLVHIKSFAYTSDKAELVWQGDGRGVYPAAGALRLSNFVVTLEPERTFVFGTGSGQYTVLEFVVSLRRNMSYPLMQSYLPSLIFVIVSWLAFFIPKDKVQERVECCLVTLLSLTVMLDAVTKSMPPISYLSALHIWMTACTIFVFLVFTEIVIVLKLRSSANALWIKVNDEEKKTLDSPQRFETRAAPTDVESPMGVMEKDISDPGRVTKKLEKRIRQYLDIEKMLDKQCPIVFGTIFTIFNIFYWPWFILHSL